MRAMRASRGFLKLGLLIGMGCGSAVPLVATTSPWTRNPQSAVRLVTPYATAARTGDLRLGVEFQLSPGWHAYWRNPGSAGFPPAFNSQTPQLRILETRWPAPSHFDLPGGLVAFGYANDVVYPLRARLQASGDTVRLTVNADYLVCEVECVPYRYDLALDQPLADAATTDPEGEAALAQWESQVPAAAGQADAASASVAWKDDTHGELRLAFPSATGKPDLFFEIHDLLELGTPVRQAGDEVAFVVPATRRDTRRPLPRAGDVAWTLVGLEGPGPRAIEGHTSLELATGHHADWRWIAAAAVLGAILVAFVARRRPSLG
jgi:suppressor for copper-sensitivity B